MTGNASTHAVGTEASGRSEPKSPTTMGGASVSDVLAAEFFPVRWAHALKLTGKKGSNRRRMLRRQAENEVILRGLRAECATCATCRHRDRRDGKSICDLDSDFHGYTVVATTHLCARFARQASNPTAEGGE